LAINLSLTLGKSGIPNPRPDPNPNLRPAPALAPALTLTLTLTRQERHPGEDPLPKLASGGAPSKKRARGSKGVASLMALERRNGRKDAGKEKDPRKARQQLRKNFDCDSGDGKGVVRVFCWIEQIAPPPSPPAPPPSPPSPNPPPSPAPLSPSATQWTFTGSWSPAYELGTSGTGKEIGSCTEEWSPPIDRCQHVLPATTTPGDEECPPGETVAGVACPAEFSIVGSTNNVITGQLTILSGRTSAWNEIRFEGAQVLSVDVSPGFDDSNPLMPKLVREQAWALTLTRTRTLTLTRTRTRTQTRTRTRTRTRPRRGRGPRRAPPAATAPTTFRRRATTSPP